MLWGEQLLWNWQGEPWGGEWPYSPGSGQSPKQEDERKRQCTPAPSPRLWKLLPPAPQPPLSCFHRLVMSEP